VLQDLSRPYLQAVNIAPGDEKRDEHENTEDEPKNLHDFGLSPKTGDSGDDEAQTYEAIEN
jgi:hypothetical protein